MTARTLNFFAAAFCATLVGAALYIGDTRGLEACPLCGWQRIAFILTGFTLLLATIHHPRCRGLRIYTGIASFFSLTGLFLASWHVWLQSLPKDVEMSCGVPDLGYLIDAVGLRGALKAMFETPGSCVNIDWTFLGMTMAAWALIGFSILLIYCIVIWIFAKKLSRQNSF